jgi:hypothetical protein
MSSMDGLSMPWQIGRAPLPTTASHPPDSVHLCVVMAPWARRFDEDKR